LKENNSSLSVVENSVIVEEVKMGSKKQRRDSDELIIVMQKRESQFCIQMNKSIVQEEMVEKK
jgi:hypothetical protein